MMTMKTTMTTKTNGKIDEKLQMVAKQNEFCSLYFRQLNFQKRLLNDHSYDLQFPKDFVLPFDDVKFFEYHCLSLLEEVGELVKSDKRWKNFRNKKYDKQNKLEEIADCFVTLFNISIFSGFSAEELYNKINEKISENHVRYGREKENADDNYCGGN